MKFEEIALILIIIICLIGLTTDIAEEIINNTEIHYYKGEN